MAGPVRLVSLRELAGALFACASGSAFVDTSAQPALGFDPSSRTAASALHVKVDTCNGAVLGDLLPVQFHL